MQNQLGIHMISEAMHRQVFGDAQVEPLAPEVFREVAANYQRFGLPFPVDQSDVLSSELIDYEFQMPRLKGKDIVEHLDRVGRERVELLEYDIRELLNLKLEEFPLGNLEIVPGWTWYSFDGSQTQQVDCPADEMLVADCETFVKQGNRAVMYGAVGIGGWYVWLHPSLCDDQIPYSSILVPFGDGKTVIGHNVSFDKARILEAYDIGNQMQFLDTMSMHIATAGFGGAQRWATTVPVEKQPKWLAYGTTNSLVACYNFYCFPDKPLGAADKLLRDIFVVSEDISQIKYYLNDLVGYMMQDVKITHELSVALYPRYRFSNPSPITLAGILNLGSSLLPVVSDWDEWADHVDEVWVQTQVEITAMLEALAQDLIKQYDSGELTDEMIAEDSWWSQLDWTRKSARCKRGAGQPLWYFNRGELTTRNRTSHILLRLSWENCPIVWRGKEGWMIKRDGYYEKPYHDSEGAINVLLCKEYSSFFDREVLTSSSPDAQELMAKAISITYWTSVRGRVSEQMVTEATNHFTGKKTKTIVPSLVVHGTVTRRGMEPLWLTVTSAKSHRVGTELKSRISAPEDCVFVQADHDGQELRIASMLADSVKSYIGSSLMSFSVIAGDKNKGTDPHTMLAKLIKVCRDTAKTCYYALIYGAGIKTLINSFKWEHRSASEDSLRATAQQIVGYRKGKKAKGSRVYVGGTDSEAFTMMEQIASEPVPRTSVLGSAMTAPMRPQHVGHDFHTGRCNWTVQSSAVDQLHIFTTAVEYLFKKYKLRAQFVWSY